MKLPKYDLIGGYVGLVVNARLGALCEGMHFSHSKNALLLYFFCTNIAKFLPFHFVKDKIISVKLKEHFSYTNLQKWDKNVSIKTDSILRFALRLKLFSPIH